MRASLAAAHTGLKSTENLSKTNAPSSSNQLVTDLSTHHSGVGGERETIEREREKERERERDQWVLCNTVLTHQGKLINYYSYDRHLIAFDERYTYILKVET